MHEEKFNEYLKKFNKISVYESFSTSRIELN